MEEIEIEILGRRLTVTNPAELLQGAPDGSGPDRPRPRKKKPEVQSPKVKVVKLSYDRVTSVDNYKVVVDRRPANYTTFCLSVFPGCCGFRIVHSMVHIGVTMSEALSAIKLGIDEVPDYKGKQLFYACTPFQSIYREFLSNFNPLISIVNQTTHNTNLLFDLSAAFSAQEPAAPAQEVK